MSNIVEAARLNQYYRLDVSLVCDSIFTLSPLYM